MQVGHSCPTVFRLRLFSDFDCVATGRNANPSLGRSFDKASLGSQSLFSSNALRNNERAWQTKKGIPKRSVQGCLLIETRLSWTDEVISCPWRVLLQERLQLFSSSSCRAKPWQLAPLVVRKDFVLLRTDLLQSTGQSVRRESARCEIEKGQVESSGSCQLTRQHSNRTRNSKNVSKQVLASKTTLSA